MKRITPEQGREAFRKAGLNPIRGEWGYDGGGCLVTALTLAVGQDIRKCPADKGYLEFAAEILGVTPQYAAGLISGFDYDGQPEWVQKMTHKYVVPNCPEGFTDGRLAAMAIFGGLLDPVEEKVSA